MLMASTAKNKMGFVDGRLRPSSDDLLFGSWIQCNSMVTSWLLNSVAKEIVDSLLYLTSAFEIWFDFRDRFLQGNGPRVFQIKKHLTSLQQASLDVNGYYTRLKTLWDKLRDF